MPTLTLTFEVQSDNSAARVATPERRAQPYPLDAEGAQDDGAPCMMGLALLLLLVFSSAFLCTRALRLLAARRREQPVTRQILVDCTADELSSPLLVVEERTVAKAI